MVLVAKKLSWFQTALKLRGSVFPVILPRILLLSGFCFLVALAHHLSIFNELKSLGDITSNVACNLVLGLLLVFRTNTAYERFWEGRKAWGALVVNIRNLAREIQIGIPVKEDSDQTAKDAALKNLVAFAIATKLHLRKDSLQPELSLLLPPQAITRLTQVKHPPIEITLWLGDYIQQQYQQHVIEVNQRVALTHLLNQLIEGLTSCERILTTPMPIAYAVYLKRLTLIYCGFLPFKLVDTLSWWAIPVVAVICFVLLGVEEIGNEIENPFGRDPNDLPLDDICKGILDQVQQASSFAPSNPSLAHVPSIL